MEKEESSFKYSVGDFVSFSTYGEWHTTGEGTILRQQEYKSCKAYLIETKNGIKFQVVEEQILKPTKKD